MDSIVDEVAAVASRLLASTDADDRVLGHELAALLEENDEKPSEARAYRAARRRLRLLHTSLAGRRQDWANNTEDRCAAARAVAYQSTMQSVHSIIDEIEAIAGGVR